MMMMIIMHGFDFRKQSIEAWHQQSQCMSRKPQNRRNVGQRNCSPEKRSKVWNHDMFIIRRTKIKHFWCAQSLTAWTLIKTT